MLLHQFKILNDFILFLFFFFFYSGELDPLASTSAALAGFDQL